MALILTIDLSYLKEIIIVSVVCKVSLYSMQVLIFRPWDSYNNIDGDDDT